MWSPLKCDTACSSVTDWPGRFVLGYGPASVTTLSPSAETTRTGIGGRSGNFIVQVLASSETVMTTVAMTLSFGPSRYLFVHTPATFCAPADAATPRAAAMSRADRMGTTCNPTVTHPS